MQRIGAWQAEFKAHPEKIVDDGFWRAHRTSDREAEHGLAWFLQDPNVEITPQIAEYALRHFPEEAALVFHRVHYTQHEMRILAEDSTFSVDSRREAIRRLARDTSFHPSAGFKEIVVRDAPLELGWMFRANWFSDDEIRAFAQKESVPYHVRYQFQAELRRRVKEAN